MYVDHIPLDALCRCGHARRFHKSGNIFENYSTGCHQSHTERVADYRGGCFCFEAAAGWQDALADSLRSEGWLVVRPHRDSLGRFLPALAQP